MTTQAQALRCVRQPDSGQNGAISNETFAEIMHELCVPLSSVGTAVDLLLKEDDSLDPRDATRLLQRVRDSTRWMRALVTDLAFLTADTIDDELPSYPFNLGRSLQEAARVAQPLFDARGQSLKLSLPARPVVIWGQERLIRRVTLNLLSNAAKYAPEEDTVRVKLKSEPRTALVEVVNHGAPLAGNELERIFQPQVRGTLHQHSDVPGQGLGLSIVKTLVEEHGGRVGVRRCRGRATAFWFALPRKRRRVSSHRDR